MVLTVVGLLFGLSVFIGCVVIATTVFRLIEIAHTFDVSGGLFFAVSVSMKHEYVFVFVRVLYIWPLFAVRMLIRMERYAGFFRS